MFALFESFGFIWPTMGYGNQITMVECAMCTTNDDDDENKN